MKYFLSLVLALNLTGCFSDNGPRQALPPELLDPNPLNTSLPPVGSDPLAEFPPIIEQPPVTEVESPPTIEELEENPPVSQAANDANCSAIVTDLETSFGDMNFCDTDSDCAYAEGSCPFGCYLFHNKAIDFADYQPTLDDYKQNCTPCEYKCASPPRASNLRCREGRCVDTRYDS